MMHILFLCVPNIYKFILACKHFNKKINACQIRKVYKDPIYKRENKKYLCL